MIAVTGGSGFLGEHVLAALSEKRLDFLLLLRSEILSRGIPSDRKCLINFSKVEEIGTALRGATQILHLAGRINGRDQDLIESNPSLMQRLTAGARLAGIKRIVYVSSAAAQFRNGPYGRTKWEAEEILKDSGIPYLIFRPTLLYGVGDKKNIATMEKVIKYSPFVPLLGGGTFLIQPLYVEDAVSVLIRSLESPLTNRIYNLAGPSQISLKEMIEVLAQRMGKKPILFPVPLKPLQALVRVCAFLFPGTKLPAKQILELDKHNAFDIEDAKRDFDFSPRPFREGILAMENSRAASCAG